MSVSLILPYFNPPANWSENIADQFKLLSQQISEPMELIVVNDGSTSPIPGSDIEYLKKHIPGCVLISYNENRGKGYAIRQGVSVANTDIVLYTDVDFPYTTESIFKVYNELKTGNAEVAMGVKDDKYYINVPPARRAISKILRWMIRNFFSIPYSDTQCGLKGFTKNVKPVFLSTTVDRYLFDLEFIRTSHKQNFKIVAVPVVLKDGIEFRKVNYRILLPEILNLAKLLLK